MDDNFNQAENSREIYFIQKRERLERYVEAMIWLFVASGFVIYASISSQKSKKTSLEEIFSFDQFGFFIATGSLLIPAVFKLIFGSLPLEFLRLSRIRRNSLRQEQDSYLRSSEEVADENADELTKFNSQLETARSQARILLSEFSLEELSTASPSELYAHYARESKSISQSIKNTAGVFLIFGGTIAFLGLAFFTEYPRL